MEQDDMLNPSALLCLMVRVLRPTRGVHTSPYGYLRGLSAEFRRVRSRRVRRYVAPAIEGQRETRAENTPPVPAPRRPAHDRIRTALSAAVPVVDSAAVAEPAALVRGHYRHYEQRTGQQKTGQQNTGRTRLGAAVPWDLAAAREGVVA